MNDPSRADLKKHPTHQQVPHPKSAPSLLAATTGSLKSVPVEIPAPIRHEVGSNFYRACNATWLRKTSLPAYRNTYSVSEELEDYLEGFLFQIAQDATAVAKRGAEPKTVIAAAEDAIGRLVLSAMRPEKQRFSVETLKQRLRGLACIQDASGVASVLTALIRDGVPTLLEIGVDTAFEGDRLVHTLQIGPGSLGLPDSRYYLHTENGPTLHSAAILREYKTLLEFVAAQFDLGFDLTGGIATESELAKHLVKATDESKLYMVPYSEVRRKFPAIPWKLLLADMDEPDRIGILSLGWLGIVDSLFKSLPIALWRAILGISVATHGIQFLPPPYDQHHFALYGRRILGQAKKIPQHVLTMNVLRSTMSEYMSYFFVKRFLAKDAKKRATKFAESIVSAAEKRVQKTAWLEPASRGRLVKKIRAMKRRILYPDPLVVPKPPALHTERFLENIYMLNATKFARALKRLGKSAEEVWDEPAYTVNAYYYPDSNQIILPAGYFFWPFYDPGRLGWSYGGLGAIIAHEIVHAFDEDGKEYDERGRERRLWSKKDERAFERHLSAIISLYGKAKVGGAHVNGKETASENLADLGGVAIALEALEAALVGRPAAERLRELREFFWSYAVSWRTKEREKKALQNIFVDKHAPAEIRVNYVVAQFDAWYEAFGSPPSHSAEAFSIVTGDNMYVPPEERLRIF